MFIPPITAIDDLTPPSDFTETVDTFLEDCEYWISKMRYVKSQSAYFYKKHEFSASAQSFADYDEDYDPAEMSVYEINDGSYVSTSYGEAISRGRISQAIGDAQITTSDVTVSAADTRFSAVQYDDMSSVAGNFSTDIAASREEVFRYTAYSKLKATNQTPFKADVLIVMCTDLDPIKRDCIKVQYSDYSNQRGPASDNGYSEEQQQPHYIIGGTVKRIFKTAEKVKSSLPKTETVEGETKTANLTLGYYNITHGAEQSETVSAQLRDGNLTYTSQYGGSDSIEDGKIDNAQSVFTDYPFGEIVRTGAILEVGMSDYVTSDAAASVNIILPEITRNNDYGGYARVDVRGIAWVILDVGPYIDN